MNKRCLTSICIKKKLQASGNPGVFAYVASYLTFFSFLTETEVCLTPQLVVA